MTLPLNGQPTEFKIYTGGRINRDLSKSSWRDRSPTLCTPKKILRSPSNRKLQVKDQFTSKLKCGSNEVQQELFVVQNLHSHLLGHPAIEAMDLVVQVSAIQ